jgi:pilus assembly protein CpaB
MTSRLLASRSKPDEPEETVKVLVAKAQVVGFTPIKDPEKLFEVREIPRSLAPKRPVADIADLKDQKLNKTIAEDHQLLQDDLLSKDQMGLQDSLKPGQIAVAIKVNAESLAGGFVLPGTRVIVISTVTRDRKLSANMILQDMLVLAVGDNTAAERDPDKKSMVAQTVTLAATPEEAGRLKLAQSMGDLSLLLKPSGETSSAKHFVIKPDDLNTPIGKQRNPDEIETPGKTEVTAGARGRTILPEVGADKEAERLALAARAKANRDQHRMRIINGSAVVHKVFKLGGDDDEGGSSEEPSALPKDALKVTPVKVAPPTYPGGTAGGAAGGMRMR